MHPSYCTNRIIHRQPRKTWQMEPRIFLIQMDKTNKKRKHNIDSYLSKIAIGIYSSSSPKLSTKASYFISASMSSVYHKSSQMSPHEQVLRVQFSTGYIFFCFANRIFLAGDNPLFASSSRSVSFIDLAFFFLILFFFVELSTAGQLVLLVSNRKEDGLAVGLDTPLPSCSNFSLNIRKLDDLTGGVLRRGEVSTFLSIFSNRPLFIQKEDSLVGGMLFVLDLGGETRDIVLVSSNRALWIRKEDGLVGGMPFLVDRGDEV